MLDIDSALLVNVWSDLGLGLTTVPAAAPPPVPSRTSEAELERAAWAVAEKGADRARAAGLDAAPVIRVGAGPRDIARVLIEVAVEYGCDLMVVGHRHASMLESALLGSVAVSCVRAERKPVLVVPDLSDR
jgi:nucleotide-binding universal stress UspA family protein